MRSEVASEYPALNRSSQVTQKPDKALLIQSRATTGRISQPKIIEPMIDLHSHILYGVDDGARSLEQSIKMCHMAATDGTTHIVATPHSNSQYIFLPEKNKEKIAELQSHVGDTPKILSGCDFHLSYENIQEALQNPVPFTINHKNYLLVEFDSYVIPQTIQQVFFELLSIGIIPVITHPERNQVIQRHPQLVFDWVNSGCLSPR